MKYCPYCGKSIHSSPYWGKCVRCGAYTEDEKLGKFPSYLENGKGLCRNILETKIISLSRGALLMLRVEGQQV